MELSPLSQAIPSFGAPTLEGFDTSNVQDNQRIGGLKRQLVRFYNKQEPMIAATKVEINEKTGFTKVLETKVEMVDKEYVLIVTPGDKNKFDGHAEPEHRREHFRQYKAYRDGDVGPLGTDLEDVDFISASVRTELKYLGCQTLEQMADASDILCGQIADGFLLRDFARGHVKAQSEGKTDKRVEFLESQLSQSQSALLSMQEEMTKMKGLLFKPDGTPFEPVTEPKARKVRIEPT